jgi:hypothetical protein
MPTLPWTIPKPLPPHDGHVTVMASRLELRRRRNVPSFLVAALRIRQQMLTSPGAGPTCRPPRPVRWMGPEGMHSVENIGQRRYHAIRVELK